MLTDPWPVPEHELPLDWGQLYPGQQVVVRRDAVVLHRGTVEDTGAHLGLVWIRDAGTGLRKMLSRHDVTLHPDPTDTAWAEPVRPARRPAPTGHDEATPGCPGRFARVGPCTAYALVVHLCLLRHQSAVLADGRSLTLSTV
jgi:hypothetical protein